MKTFHKWLCCLGLVVMTLGIGLPAQAGMVTTSELQQAVVVADLSSTAEKREWIEQQLVQGGVAQPEAVMRVGAMTDAEVAAVYQRIDEAAAGGDVVLVAIIVILVLELTGVIDIFNF